MKRWGYAVSAFYLAVVAILLVPAWYMLTLKSNSLSKLDIIALYAQTYTELAWPVGIYIGVLVAGQALLLFLSVDSTWQRIKPRQHVAVTIALAAFFTGVLAWSAVISVEVAIFGNSPPRLWMDHEDLFVWTLFAMLAGLWLFWGGVFYQYYHGSSSIVSKIVPWLLKGSVLELLIAVPAHVTVRQRGDCSAPVATAFGIVTGLAIMLLSFGPGVLALYKKKIDAYSRKQGPSTGGGA